MSCGSSDNLTHIGDSCVPYTCRAGEFPCVNKEERHNCCLLICGQRTVVLAPLISSEEGGDMNGSAVWQFLSWFTQRAACLCQAGENPPRNPRGCVICLHAEKTDLLPSSALHLCSQSRHSQEGQRLGEQELAWPDLRCQRLVSVWENQVLCYMLPDNPSYFYQAGGSLSPGRALL